jgi:hypothetical protein
LTPRHVPGRIESEGKEIAMLNRTEIIDRLKRIAETYRMDSPNEYLHRGAVAAVFEALVDEANRIEPSAAAFSTGEDSYVREPVVHPWHRHETEPAKLLADAVQIMRPDGKPSVAVDLHEIVKLVLDNDGKFARFVTDTINQFNAVNGRLRDLEEKTQTGTAAPRAALWCSECDDWHPVSHD